MTVSGTPGTGAITLGSAVSGSQTFAAAGVVNGQVIAVNAYDPSTGLFDFGRFTYSSTGPTLTRTTILSNGGVAQNLTAATIITATLLGEETQPLHMQTVADANSTVAIGDGAVGYTSITAARTVTLLAANTYFPGQKILVLDISGSCSSTNTITPTRAGSDTINGATTQAISTAYGSMTLISDGVSKWTVI